MRPQGRTVERRDGAATQGCGAASQQRPRFDGAWKMGRLKDVAQLHRDHVMPSDRDDVAYEVFSLPAYDVGRSPSTEMSTSIQSGKFRVPSNAVLLSRLNPRIPRVWAPPSLAPNAVASTEFLVLTPRESTVRSFLFWLCSSPQFFDRMVAAATGTTGSHQRVSRSDAMNIRIWIPPLVEQRAIATTLSDVDGLIASVEALIVKKRAIKRAAMQQLLTGRTRLPGFKEHWGTRQLGEVSEMASGGTPSTSVAANWSGSIPWITGADIVRQSVAKIRRYITEDAVASSATNVVAKGDLLVVSRTGVGKLAIAPCDIAISQDVTGIIPNRKQLTSAFIFRYLDYSRHVLASQNQGTSIKGITRGALAEMVVPVPTLAEQRAIATVLTDMDDDLGALERRLDKTRAIKKGMMQQLLTGAIRLPIPDDTPEGEVDGG